MLASADLLGDDEDVAPDLCLLELVDERGLLAEERVPAHVGRDVPHDPRHARHTVRAQEPGHHWLALVISTGLALHRLV